MRRRWAACVDLSPFAIRIERRCWSRSAARRVAQRYGRWSAEPWRWFVATSAEARELDRRVHERLTSDLRAGGMVRSRFELDMELPA